MSAATRAASSGVVIGIVVVILGQQLGWIDFTQTIGASLQILIGAVVGGVVFGLLGVWIGARARRRQEREAAAAGAAPAPATTTPPSTL
ncbi:MAG: hypothetical protein WCA77_10020 [Thermoplasmata archaeon]